MKKAAADKLFPQIGRSGIVDFLAFYEDKQGNIRMVTYGPTDQARAAAIAGSISAILK